MIGCPFHEAFAVARPEREFEALVTVGGFFERAMRRRRISDALGAPRPNLVIAELNIGQRIADLDGYGVTQVRPRCSLERSIASMSRSVEPSQDSRSAGPSSNLWPASVSATTTGACPPAASRIGSG